MNSTNQLEADMDVSYATFLVPIQEGLGTHYIVQQLPSHAGDDPISGLIKLPENIDLVVLDYTNNSIEFYRECQYIKGYSSVLRTNEVESTVRTKWESLQHLKKSIINKEFPAKILWEKPAPAREESTSEYLTVALGYALVNLTQYEAENYNSPLIIVPNQAYYLFLNNAKGKTDLVFYSHNFEQVWLYNHWESSRWEARINDGFHYITTVHNMQLLWQRSPTCTEHGNTAELPAKTPRTAIGIADAALQHIKDRATTYDSPEGERSALKTAQAFNAITGKDLTEAEVFLLLQILKDVRQWQKSVPHQDSLEDCIAYAALKAEAKEKEG